MDTRTALLDSAERSVRQRGYEAFSYADLARDVGIRKASIHYHFPAKADLALSLIERYCARFFETLAEIDRTHTAATDKLRAYHQVYREALAGGTQICLCVSMSASRDSFSDAVLSALNQFHTDSVAWLTSVFETALSAESVRSESGARAEAKATLALLEGAQLLSRAAKDITLFDQATEAFLRRLGPTNRS